MKFKFPALISISVEFIAMMSGFPATLNVRVPLTIRSPMFCVVKLAVDMVMVCPV